MEDATRYRPSQYRNAAVALILGLLLFRVVTLVLSPSGLHGDEAQYWAWSRDLDAGYYSKPPLIAWVIAATTAVFGQSEWAVRLASPFLHAGAAAFCYLSARTLYGAKAGLWAAALYALMPGVSLSSTLISTDALLLFHVSVFVYAWVRLREGGGARWAGLLGLAIGFGLLAKYAMLFVLPAFGLAIVFDPKTRRALLTLKGVMAGLIALIVVSPNLVWNARNDFATVAHTGDNANMSDGVGLHPGEWLEFFGGQFGVFGPLTFAALLLALLGAGGEGRRFRVWLALLVLTPLVLISVQALLSRANANWAAVAYGTAPVLLAGWVIGVKWRAWLVGAGLVINLVLAVVPPLVLLSPTLTDSLGFANSVKRQRGWPDTVAAIRRQLETGAFDAVAVDNRLMFYDLLYYGLEDTAPLYMWRYEPRLNNHAELTRSLPQDDRRVLLVSFYHDYDDYFRDDFDQLTRRDDIEIDLGGGKVRRLRTYAARGYDGPRVRED